MSPQVAGTSKFLDRTLMRTTVWSTSASSSDVRSGVGGAEERIKSERSGAEMDDANERLG